jgi:hypothetical protein
MSVNVDVTVRWFRKGILEPYQNDRVVYQNDRVGIHNVKLGNIGAIGASFSQRQARGILPTNS